MPVDVASGTVTLYYQDLFVPGKVDLEWDRSYSTSRLQMTGGPLGRGWTCSHFATLSKQADSFRFFTPEGSLEVFAGDAQAVDRGHVVRNLGAFLELFRKDDRYIVQRWNSDTQFVIRYCFDARDSGEPMQLQAVEDLCGRGLELVWSRDALLEVRQPFEQRSLQIAYGAHGKIERLVLSGKAGTYPAASFEYDLQGRQIAAYDADGFADRYDYDDDGRLVREIAKDGGIFTYQYDRLGRCIKTSGLDRYLEKRLRYFDASRFAEVTDSYDRTFRYQHLPSGQIACEIDPLGHEKKTVYDEHGRNIVSLSATGGITTYSYDECGNRSSITDPLGNTYKVEFNDNHQAIRTIDPLGQVWQRGHDASNRLTFIQNPLGNRWLFRYDDFDNIVEVEDPLGACKRSLYRDGTLETITDWTGNVTHYRFDAFGRITEHIGPIGDNTRLRYDRRGNPIQLTLTDGTALHCEYDVSGNLTKFVDGNGDTTTYRYGTCQRLLERIDANGGVVRYVWGREPDWLEQIFNEKGETYHWFRDASGRIVRERSFDGVDRSFVYDASNYTAAYTNANGETIRIHRDALHRIIAYTLPDGERLDYSYDSVGNLRSAVCADVPVAYECDALGRIVRESWGDRWVSKRYDPAGHLIQVATSLGQTIDYGVDRNGFLTEVRTAGQKLEFQRNPYGQEIVRALPGGHTLEHRYDSLGRMIGQELRCKQAAAGSVRSLYREFSYDGNSSLAKATDDRWGQVEYSYDGAERLLKVVREEGPSESFGYDRAGNMTRYSQNGKTALAERTLEYGDGNRLIRNGSVRYEYDKEGRRIKKIEAADTQEPRVWNYQWDALDRLRAVVRPDGETTRYKYDALYRRVEKKSAEETQTYLWDRSMVLQESDGLRPPATWIVDPYSCTPLATVQNEELYCAVTDHLGTPRELIDGNASVAWSILASAWGGEWRCTVSRAAIDCPIRFQGQWFDTESGLHYNNRRYFDPECGQFTSQDPIGLRGGFNLYAYAPNPISWIDPLGLACGPAAKKNSKGRWIDAQGKFAKKPPAPNFTAQSAAHEAGIPGTAAGYHGAGTPNPLNGAGAPIAKSKFNPGEGGAAFASEVYNHPDVTATQQGGASGRWRYEVADLGRGPVGTNQAGGPVDGGRVIAEGNPAVNPVNSPADVVTQFPQ